MLMRHLLLIQEHCVVVSKELESGEGFSGRLVHFQMVSRLFGMLKKDSSSGQLPNVAMQMLSTEDVIEGSVSLAVATEDIPPGGALFLVQSGQNVLERPEGVHKSFTDFDILL